jgi:hypothetical protein
MGRWCVPGGVAILVWLVAVSAPASAWARVKTQVSLRSPKSVTAGGLVSFTGSASVRSSGRLAVQRRSGRRWLVIARGHLGGSRRFALTWIAPAKAGTLSVRAVAYGPGRVVGASAPTTLLVRASRGAPVLVSPKTRVLDASTVNSVPSPGTTGQLRYSGGNDVQPGQIIAIGQGPATPAGFLGRVTRVTTSGGETTASTTPATLQEAIPSASFDETVASQGPSVDRAASRALARAAAASVVCQGSAKASVKPDISFGTSIELKGSWSLFHGLQSASLTAGAHANASLTATVEGQGSCSLEPVTVAKFNGPGATFFIGPIPVVLTSELSVDLDAGASASAALTTGVSTGFSAEAGVGWNKKSGFYPINTFTPHFQYTSPALTANADVNANLTPKIDVLLYGVAGPQLALKAGLDLSADVSNNPWWALTAPVDLTASLDVPPLGFSSPKLTLYRHTFTLATAGGPFGGGGPTGVPAPTTPPPPATIFDGSPGAGPPPATLGPFAMQPFPVDPTDEGTLVSGLDGPTGTITFDNPLEHDLVGSNWQTWSNDYTGDVYETDMQAPDGGFDVTITLPPHTGAFYLYAEPNVFQEFNVSATAADGTTSGDMTVLGDSGAQYFGFYATCGHSLSSVHVQDTGGDTAMAIGEFGIAPAC